MQSNATKAGLRPPDGLADGGPASVGASRRVLANYEHDGVARRIVVRAGAEGSLLVIDEQTLSLADRRLVAHLAADEPLANAEVVCARYLADPGQRRARPLSELDWIEPAPGANRMLARRRELGDRGRALRGPDGADFRLAIIAGREGREWRWTRRVDGKPSRVVSVRVVVGALQAYEPVCELTRARIARQRRGDRIAVCTLADELARIATSPFVLNRALREAALEAVANGLSFSQIAARCGRGARADDQIRVGDTSWLARRLGLRPETNRSQPSPWIHTDVLALIARHGLGIDPREVELA